MLVWYFATLSQVGVVYGSMTTAIVVLLSLELGATLVLLGAQVISEYERLRRPRAQAAAGRPRDPCRPEQSFSADQEVPASAAVHTVKATDCRRRRAPCGRPVETRATRADAR